MPKQDQIDRLQKINELLIFMADLERPVFRNCMFFSEKTYKGNANVYARFEFIGNRLYFIDKYTEEKVYPYQSRLGINSKRRRFSNGGTIWALINDFREWIITGKSSDGNNGYGGLYCTHWGWSLELKDKVIQKAKDIGYISEFNRTFTDFCKMLIANGNNWKCERYLEEIEAVG